MKKFLKNNWGRILLFILLTVICTLSFSKGKYLMGNDNYSPELNPSLTILRSLESPAWRSYRVLGFGSESEQSDIFRSVFFWITEKILPTESLGQIFGLLSLFVGTWFMGELVSVFIKDYFKKKYSQVSFLLGGLIYMTTLWTVWTYYQNLAPFTSNFGFLPLLLYSIYMYLKVQSPKRAIFLFFSSVVFTSSCVIATLFLSDFLLILPFIFFVVFTQENTKGWLKKISKTLLIFFLTQLFWILPFIHYTISSSNDIVDSYINRSITATIIDLEADMQTLVNSSRFYSRVLTENREGVDIFPLSEDFQNYDYYKVVGLLPIFFALVGIVMMIVKKKWKLLPIPIFTLAVLFFIKGVNPPLGIVFEFFQQYIPLFKQVFRWVSSKLGEIYLITLVISSVFGSIMLSDFLLSFLKKKNIRMILGILLLTLLSGLQLFYSNYLFTGDFYSEYLLADLPDEYFELQEYLEEENPTGRIYIAPSSNNNYFREYGWGFYGSNFMSYIIPNPILDMSLAIGSGIGEEAMLNLENVFRSGDFKSFDEQLKKYDVEYIFIDREMVEDGFVFDFTWDEVDLIVGNYERVWNEGDLELYRVPSDTDVQYLEYLNQSVDVLEGYFTRDISSNPRVSLLNSRFENGDIDSNLLSQTFKYTGNTVNIRSNIEDINWETLPTGIKIEGGKLKVYPASPTLSGYYSTVPYREYYITGYEYISVNSYIFSISELEKGVFIEDDYNKTTNVFGIEEDDFKSMELTNILGGNKGYNCQSEEIVEDIKVEVQEGSSGFSLTGKGIPCTYKVLELDSENMYGYRVNLNWETSSEDVLGYCMYSQELDRCLNSNKYIYTKDLVQEREILVPKISEKGDTISLILYIKNLKDDTSAEVFLRDVTVEYTPLLHSLGPVSVQQEWEYSSLEMEDGKEYTVEMPILRGTYSYVFDGKDDFIWEVSPIGETVERYEISSEKGMSQIVKEGSLIQSNNLFVPNSLRKYLMFWKGENISNIPAELCLSYVDTGECWLKDYMTEDIYVRKFESGNMQNRWDSIIESSSYKRETENILNDFGVMEIPKLWEDIEMIPVNNQYYQEYEIFTLYDSPRSTIYSSKLEDIPTDEYLLSIPQRYSSGWLALGIKNRNVILLNDDYRVVIDGWKQAWDISNFDFDTVYVIYWPNLLGYFGYVLILTEGIYLTFKLFKKKNG